MENINTSSEKTRHITLSLVFSWIFSIFVGVPAIMMLFSQTAVGLVSLIAALIVFPPAIKFLKDKFNFSLSRGLKIVSVLILLIIAGSMASGNKTPLSQQQSNQGSVSEKSQPSQEIIKVSAIKLSEEYKANEIAADAKYKGNIVEVTGVVENIGKDIIDAPYIALKSYEYAIVDKVQCYFSKADEAQLATVVKDRQITLRGEVSGKMGNIIFRGCQIVK